MIDQIHDIYVFHCPGIKSFEICSSCSLSDLSDANGLERIKHLLGMLIKLLAKRCIEGNLSRAIDQLKGSRSNSLGVGR